ncbi:hypothetical protein HU200_011287 [Digitaria exilis]|uniref:Uncharacterized protein n=1 Tax=Digitaria exilis TaxID=1010633 RepID=A0A835FIN5_9POAL|nr:hypothetical protein HU200_011287 [Digitaria exilis]CAB3475132.1 unnamed protein product [Digitaria exilis]
MISTTRTYVICTVATWCGKFYFNSPSTELGVLEFCPGPVFSFIKIDNTIATDGSYGYSTEDNQATRCKPLWSPTTDGELFMVILLSNNTSRDKIFGSSDHRMNFAERQWPKVKDLGGRVSLLSLFYFGASCAGGGDDDHGLKDHVHMVYPVRKTLLVFDVREGTIEMQNFDREVPASDKGFRVLPTNL